MSDVWELIIGHSSLPSGDVWEHLNAQVETGETILVDAVRTVDTVTVCSASLASIGSTAEITDVISATITEQIYTASCTDALEATT